MSLGTPARVEILERRRAHDGFIGLDVLRLRHERFDGAMSPMLRRELIVQRRAVAVLPWDPAADALVLTLQFRAGLVDDPGGAWSLEGVAGLIDGDEAPAVAAAREVKEETGLELVRLTEAGAYHSSPGASSEHVTCFIGQVEAPAASGIFGHAAEAEDIRVEAVPFAAAVAALEAGRITAANTLVPLLWLRLHRERLAAAWAAA